MASPAPKSKERVAKLNTDIEKEKSYVLFQEKTCEATELLKQDGPTSSSNCGCGAPQGITLHIMGRPGSGKTRLVSNLYGSNAILSPKPYVTASGKLLAVYTGMARGEHITVYEDCHIEKFYPTAPRMRSNTSACSMLFSEGKQSPPSRRVQTLAREANPSSSSLNQQFDVVILCLPLNQATHEEDLRVFPNTCGVLLKPNWSNVVLALTFADEAAAKLNRQQPISTEQFNSLIEKRVKAINAVVARLRRDGTYGAIWNNIRFANNLKVLPQCGQVFPTAYDANELLQSGYDWFTPFWTTLQNFSLSEKSHHLRSIMSKAEDERVVMFPYEVQHLDELVLHPNDIITNIQWYQDGVWAFGKCGSQQGLFHPLILKQDISAEEEEAVPELRQHPSSYQGMYAGNTYFFKQESRRQSDDFHSCPVCLQLASTPVLTSCCSRSFCSKCITASSIQKCPLCRKTEKDGFSYHDDQKTKRIVESRVVYCPNYIYGCDWEGEIFSVETHVSQSCPVITCSQGCGTKYLASFQKNHITLHCPVREVTCRFCATAGSDGKMSHREMITSHCRTCPRWPMRCYPHCTDQHHTRASLKVHRELSCTEHVVACDFAEFGCNEKFKREYQGQHEKNQSHLHLSLVTRSYKNVVEEVKTLRSSLDEVVEELKKLKS